MSKQPAVVPDSRSASPSPDHVKRWQAFLFNRERRDQWLTTGLLLAFALGGFAMWRHVRGFVLQQDEYQLDPANVEITDAPGWIRSDVREQALQQGGLDKACSLLDEDLTQRMEAAFAAHPWVERVDRVSKSHPARVEVDLVYRRPVCMVELPAGYNGVYPVDAHGVVLPTNDFTPEQASQYPRLTGVAALPSGKVGSAWGDSSVLGGSRVAAALAEHWQTLKLQKIVAVGSPAAGGPDYQYQVLTDSQVTVLWGHAPGSTVSGEPSATEKLAALQQSLAAASPGTTIDLRQPLAATKDPRTAAKPGKNREKF